MPLKSVLKIGLIWLVILIIGAGAVLLFDDTGRNQDEDMLDIEGKGEHNKVNQDEASK